jgi:hypothetical protein
VRDLCGAESACADDARLTGDHLHRRQLDGPGQDEAVAERWQPVRLTGPRVCHVCLKEHQGVKWHKIFASASDPARHCARSLEHGWAVAHPSVRAGSKYLVEDR